CRAADRRLQVLQLLPAGIRVEGRRGASRARRRTTRITRPGPMRFVVRGSAVRKVPGVVATIWLFAASVVHAQSTDPARAYLTRAEVEELRVRYEEAASSGAYS